MASQSRQPADLGRSSATEHVIHMPRDNLLFTKYDWFSVEEHQKNQLKYEVGTYDGNRLLNTSVDDLSDYFANKYSLDVPVLQRDAIVADQRETKVDKSHDFRYGPRFDGRPILVDGSTVEITVPFTGDGQLFSVRPTTFSMNSPRGDICGNTLVLQFTGVDQSSEQLKSEIEKAVTDIETHLERLRKSADTLKPLLLREGARTIAYGVVVWHADQRAMP